MQSSQSSPELFPATQPQSLSQESPLGAPAQSEQEELSPPQTPHSSSSKVDPHSLSQPDGPGSKHPQPKSSALPPLQTPHSSNSASPFGVPAQSSQSSPEFPAATQPQSLSQLSPLGTPAQSVQEELSPLQILHSS